MRPQERDILSEMRKLPTMQIGASIDWRKYKAMRSLERAIVTLFYKGDQWERGEAARAQYEAVQLLQSRIEMLRLEMFRSTE